MPAVPTSVRSQEEEAPTLGQEIGSQGIPLIYIYMYCAMGLSLRVGGGEVRG